MGNFTRSDARFPIDCFACLLIRCRIPRSAQSDRGANSSKPNILVWRRGTERACGNRRRWRKNRTGRTQGLRRFAQMKWSDDQSAVALCDGNLHLGSGTEVEPLEEGSFEI